MFGGRKFRNAQLKPITRELLLYAYILSWIKLIILLCFPKISMLSTRMTIWIVPKDNQINEYILFRRNRFRVDAQQYFGTRKT